MPTIEALVDYYSNPIPLGILVSSLAAQLGLFVYFKKDRNLPARRTVALTFMFGNTIFLWAFLGSGLALCSSLGHTLEFYDASAVKTVAGVSLLFALGVSMPVSVVVGRGGDEALLPARVKRRVLPRSVIGIFRRLTRSFGLGHVTLVGADLGTPAAYAVGAKNPAVVIDERLIGLLSQEELEAVLAHELAHLRNGDVRIKALTAVYRSVLRFDPVLRAVEAAIHREQELRADEVSADVTGGPLALASALLRMHQASRNDSSPQQAIRGIQWRKELLRRTPHLRTRVSRLIHLHDILSS
ncbi:MAG: M48 family metalloprotease [Candidatus Geothermarchaeales archaeon]